MRILDSHEVDRRGSFAVMEGDVAGGDQVATSYWVERDGVVVSSFNDIDYANIRVRMLDRAATSGSPLLPDLTGVIEVVERDHPYTILSGQFGDIVYWVVNASGDTISDWGALSFARDFIRTRRAAQAQKKP